MTNEQFDEFLKTCYQELELKQNKLFTDFDIGSYKNYWFDQLTRTLQFKNEEKAELEFNIICIGTWAHLKNTWMWCWANKSFTKECRKDSKTLKGLKMKTGLGIFIKEGFNCDETMAYEMTAMSVKQLNALGMYKIPGEKSHLFVALIKQKQPD